jgi:UDP-N-acetylmuramoyl-L-alanyl-D-glutamate--2,6-diaminopimelate ligase
VRLSDMWMDDMNSGQTTGAPTPEITGVTCDSRRVAPGFLFAAIPGTANDGRDYIPDALARGAAAILAPPGTRLPDGYETTPLLDTDNPRRRYALLAARFYPRQPETVAAVTGTNGKTSVASFLRQIWKQAGIEAASAGTLGIQSDVFSRSDGLTTPDPADLHADLAHLAELGVDHLALEASSHGLDQCRLDGVRIAAGAFTNLTRDHLDYHGSTEAYFKAKRRLFDTLVLDGGAAVINADDARGADVIAAAQARHLRVRTYGARGVDFKLLSTRPEARGQHLSLMAEGLERDLFLPLAGRFQAMNALCALGLATVTGVPVETALSGIETLTGAPGRMEWIGEKPTGGTVYVDYAHTPDALENVLTALRPHADAGLAVVFGCGGDRDRGKRPEMGRIASELADRVIVTDDNPRSEDAGQIRAEILAAAPGASEIADRGEAIETAVAALSAGEILVIAGKGHERGQIVGARMLPFDDREAARAAVAGEG